MPMAMRTSWTETTIKTMRQTRLARGGAGDSGAAMVPSITAPVYAARPRTAPTEACRGQATCARRDPVVAEAGSIADRAPDEERRADQGECDDDVERSGP